MLIISDKMVTNVDTGKAVEISKYLTMFKQLQNIVDRMTLRCVKIQPIINDLSANGGVGLCLEFVAWLVHAVHLAKGRAQG